RDRPGAWRGRASACAPSTPGPGGTAPRRRPGPTPRWTGGASSLAASPERGLPDGESSVHVRLGDDEGRPHPPDPVSRRAREGTAVAAPLADRPRRAVDLDAHQQPLAANLLDERKAARQVPEPTRQVAAHPVGAVGELVLEHRRQGGDPDGRGERVPAEGGA